MASFFKHPLENSDRPCEVENIEADANPKIVEGEGPCRKNGAHPFKNIGRREAPGDQLCPFREGANWIKDGAKGGENPGDHPGKHLNFVAPINNHAGGEKRDGPAKNKKGGSKGKKGPTDREYVECIEKIDDKRAECDGDEELA